MYTGFVKTNMQQNRRVLCPSYIAGLLLLTSCSASIDVGGVEAPVAAKEQGAHIVQVSSAVENLIRSKKISGAIVLVQHKGRIIHNRAYGFRDVENRDPFEPDDILRIYSMTKPIVSVGILMLAEEGKLNLSDPVAKFIPEFAKIKVLEGKQNVAPRRPPTIRDLLTHTAGLTYGFFSDTEVDRAYKRNHPLFSSNNQQMIDKLTTHPLIAHPGERWHYSVATDVLGHLIERVSGRSLGDFLTTQIFLPLGMKDTAFFIEAKKLSRFASSYTNGVVLRERYNKSPYQSPWRIQSGGGGLISTAPDYLKFSQMMLNDGRYPGGRLVDEASIKAMTRNHLPKGELAYGYFGFGYGVRVQISDWGLKGHIGEYGWDGAASTHFWISPADELVVIALSQRQPFSNQLQEVIKPLIYKAIAARSP